MLVVYANNINEANKQISYFKSQGYVFINFSKSNYYYSKYSELHSEDYDTHHVIGQEFNNVIIVMGDEFAYDSNGRLRSIEHPNPDYVYLKLLYQGLTRARCKICIVVLNNIDLFEKLTRNICVIESVDK